MLHTKLLDLSSCDFLRPQNSHSNVLLLLKSGARNIVTDGCETVHKSVKPGSAAVLNSIRNLCLFINYLTRVVPASRWWWFRAHWSQLTIQQLSIHGWRWPIRAVIRFGNYFRRGSLFLLSFRLLSVQVFQFFGTAFRFLFAIVAWLSAWVFITKVSISFSFSARCLLGFSFAFSTVFQLLLSPPSANPHHHEPLEVVHGKMWEWSNLSKCILESMPNMVSMLSIDVGYWTVSPGS